MLDESNKCPLCQKEIEQGESLCPSCKKDPTSLGVNPNTIIAPLEYQFGLTTAEDPISNFGDISSSSSSQTTGAPQPASQGPISSPHSDLDIFTYDLPNTEQSAHPEPSTTSGASDIDSTKTPPSMSIDQYEYSSSSAPSAMESDKAPASENLFQAPTTEGLSVQLPDHSASQTHFETGAGELFPTKHCVHCGEKIYVSLTICPNCENEVDEERGSTHLIERIGNAEDQYSPPGFVRCIKCNQQTSISARKCQFCGIDMHSTLSELSSKKMMDASVQLSMGGSPAERKWEVEQPFSFDPVIPALLSGCCMPGVGQMILGQFKKGMCILILNFIAMPFLGGANMFLINPIIAFDAYRIATKKKSGKKVGEWEWF